MRRLAFVLVLLSCTPAVVAGAQDSATARVVKAVRDSILCTASASKRQQRACLRLDSLRAGLLVAPIVVPPVDTTPTFYAAHWPVGIGAFRADTMTMCATVKRGTDPARYLAHPAILVRVLRYDSVAFTVRPEQGTALAAACRNAVPEGTRTSPIYAVTWRLSPTVVVPGGPATALPAPFPKTVGGGG